MLTSTTNLKVRAREILLQARSSFPSDCIDAKLSIVRLIFFAGTFLAGAFFTIY